MLRLSIKYKTYKQYKKQQRLADQLDVAAQIYNYCILLHRKYFNIYHKFLNCIQLKNHLTKIKKLPKYAHWRVLGSQAIQDIAERIDKAYNLFFQEKKKGNTKIKPPGLKTSDKYKSITLKQHGAGYQFFDSSSKRGIVRIGKTNYKFVQHVNLPGEIKTLTIKRDSLGDWWFVVSCCIEDSPKNQSLSGHTVDGIPQIESEGFDFGLTNFLTQSNGNTIEAPQFLKKNLGIIRKLNKIIHNETSPELRVTRAKRRLARVYRNIENRRRDWHFKLARQLVLEYDILCFETLDIESMKQIWGRKVSDYGFADFVRIIIHMAKKLGKRMVFVDKWYPSTKTCNVCKYVLPEKLDLAIREWDCISCGVHHQRDVNAAINIKNEGIRALMLGMQDVATRQIHA